MSLKRRITEFSINHYILVTVISILIAIAGLTQFPRIVIDTDPENMLSETEFIRQFDKDVRKEFTIYDMLVLGVVNEKNPQGVFNKDTLTRIFNITEKIKEIDGVVVSELMSLNTVDDIKQGSSEGEIIFEWLMFAPPVDDAAALQIGRRAKSNPMLDGTLISENGKAVAIYVPVSEKKMSYDISQKIKDIINNEKPSEDQFYITGQPVAENTFGYEMFKQMSVSAPVAGLIIFLLMWYFFKKIKMIISPMIVAVISILGSMGLMIGMGYTVHIMSSMIAIFLMPIAVVDSVHIISDFFEKYQIYKDKRRTIIEVMDELFMPMFYTTLTSIAGFVSLATAPIPPVKIFGVFVGVGIFFAWILTITFVPASIMFISDKTLENFGAKKKDEDSNHTCKTGMCRILRALGQFTFAHAKLIIIATFIISALAVWGITKININDNPVKWFSVKHDIRIADAALNKHFSGTYMASLVMEIRDTEDNLQKYYSGFKTRLNAFIDNYAAGNNELRLRLFDESDKILKSMIASNNFSMGNYQTELMKIYELCRSGVIIAPADFIEEFEYFVEDEKIYTQIFKQPEILNYIAKIEKYMESVNPGKSNSVATIVKKIHQELRGGASEQYIIPDSPKMVGECMIQFQNSHRPNDIWHFINNDFNKINIWIQLKSGDNQYMTKVVAQMDEYIRMNPAPFQLQHNWAGKTYINVIWQDKMVKGMLSNSLLSSYITVLIIMIILFKSFWYGLLAMAPLTVTIGFIYGFIGFIGKDYDMPVAILSSLTLGLAVDFAIHFIERFKHIYQKEQDLHTAFLKMFHEPATAIMRNIFVIALGFLPLLLSPLVPYKTVGFFLSAIMIVSGVGTLFILPAIMKDVITDFTKKE